MYKILCIIIFALFAFSSTSCHKFEIITRQGSKVTVNKGQHPNGDSNKTVFGKRTETDTISGHIISVTKYRCKVGCFGRSTCVTRTRVYRGGKRTLSWTREKHIYEL